MAEMGREQLTGLFDDLAAELRTRRVVGYVHLAGGAAMALAYGSDLTTGDVDALFEPDGPMIEAIRAVATKRGLPSTWMNNQASSYFSASAKPTATVYDSPNLRVMVTPPDHLLAMKVNAARAARDRDDVVLLLSVLGWTEKKQVLDAFGHYFPGEELGVRQRVFIDSLGLG